MAKDEDEAQIVEIRKRWTRALGKELDESDKWLFALHLQVATRQLANDREIGEGAPRIARFKTIRTGARAGRPREGRAQ